MAQVQQSGRLANQPPTKIYVIAFRLILKREIAQNPQNTQLLFDFDKRSHAEANALGGLLKYWYGKPDPETGQNLATCWWRNPQDAQKGGTGKMHQASVAKVRNWYELWRVEQYELELGANHWHCREI